MSKYTDDTFDIVLRETYSDSNEYVIVRTGDKFGFFMTKDVSEPAYTNHCVDKTHVKLNGRYVTADGRYYVVVKNNWLHCETGPAVCCPGGIDNFKQEDVEDYCIYGKIFSKYNWLTWVKDTASWPEAMANILGSKREG